MWLNSSSAEKSLLEQIQNQNNFDNKLNTSVEKKKKLDIRL